MGRLRELLDELKAKQLAEQEAALGAAAEETWQGEGGGDPAPVERTPSPQDPPSE